MGRYDPVPLLVLCVIVFVIVAVPFRILSYGYMPKDDALRHAAKAVSGKNWDDVLVMRDDVKMDGHPGWHALLGYVRRAMDFNAHSLVLFSVFILFILLSLVPVFLFKRPEAWAASLLVLSVADPSVFGRLLLGRPYMVTMASMIAIGCMWDALTGGSGRKRAFISITLIIAAATWVHGGWYLFALPVAALFAARRWREGALLAAAAVIGVAAGSSLTGHPVVFLTQTVKHVFLALSDHNDPGVLVTEFQPFRGDIPVVSVFILMLIWRSLRGEWRRGSVDEPVAILAVISWALGFFTTRVWLDVGLAASLLWIAMEFQHIFSKYIPYASWRRLAFVCILSAVLFAASTNDAYNRWSLNRPMNYVKFDTPEKASWAPGPGGIVYNTDMLIFYSMFYNNPDAPWRYVLGFEPAVMKPDDFRTYRKMQKNFEASSFEPWVRKMRPEDRFVIFDLTDKGPKIDGLEWFNAGNCIWIGRLPTGGAVNEKGDN